MIDKNNNSVTYLALLCLLYFLFTSNYLHSTPIDEKSINEDLIYIEISEDGVSTVKTFSDVQSLDSIKTRYSISQDIKSGDMILVQRGEISIGKMSGRKRISLGIPIGISTATSEDLEAIPGIGKELASRIISARENRGSFKDLHELDSIDGIGKKKLESIKKLMFAD